MAFKSITISELIDLLREYQTDEEAIVTFVANYGDRGATQQVHALYGEITERSIKESAYSDSGYALVKNEEDEREDQQRVIVIS